MSGSRTLQPPIAATRARGTRTATKAVKKHVQGTDLIPAAGCVIAVETHYFQIGEDFIPIYGNDRCGWSLEAEDFRGESAAALRYRSVDELLFALINMHFNSEGTA